MKLRTILIVGAAGTATYLLVRRTGTGGAQQLARRASARFAATRLPGATALGQAVQRSLGSADQPGMHEDQPGRVIPGVPSEAAADLALARQVQATLSLNPRFQPERVTVNADAGRVTLRGTTAAVDEITAFEQRARGVPGVRDVVNLLHVQGTRPPTGHRGGTEATAVDEALTVAKSLAPSQR